jgi:hypothetical protein
MFDDRLEFMSLGGVMPGVTHDLMLAGVSVTRNEKLAQIFYRLNIIEAFGTGIPRIYGAYKNSTAQPEIPVVDGGFFIRIPNMNYYAGQGAGNGKNVSVTNEQRLLEVFSDANFSKEDAADVLGITVSGAYKLLQRMTGEGLLSARKEGRRWIYSEPSGKAGQIEKNDRLDRKIVAFVGTFDGGSLRLKDLVFFAGGAPSDTIPAFTKYLVVGRGGKDAQAYKEALPMIKAGGTIELTDNELRDICSGRIPAPKPERKHNPNVIISLATKEHEKENEERDYIVFENKRAAFVHRYGVLQADGTRNKRYVV